MINKIYNEDCFVTMSRMLKNNIKTNVIISSPPYNMTKRKGGYADKSKRYDVYNDWKTKEEYIDWTVSLFNKFNTILEENGVILWNLNYSIENPILPTETICAIHNNTEFTIVDTICWKKPIGVPFPANPRRLSRNWENIYVLVRKSEINTFVTNKKITKISRNNQKYYEVHYNFIEAKNNDGACEFNKATFSSDLIRKLINIYVPNNNLVYDPFNGTGTTSLACIKEERRFIGSEISTNQCNYANKRIEDEQ